MMLCGKAIVDSTLNRSDGPKLISVEPRPNMTMNIGEMDRLDYMLVINELARKIHENARAKGFYDEAVSFPQSIALIHSEASEALEAHRNAEPTENIIEELADIVIRVLDTCGYHSYNIGGAILDKMEKNSRRPQKHGKRY